MASETHDRMVDASLKASDTTLTDVKDLQKLSAKLRPKRIPDLHSGTDMAVECMCFNRRSGIGGLKEFGRTYNRLVLTIPIPNNFTEVWLYDPDRDCIVEKFLRSARKVRARTLVCHKCFYEWKQRSEEPPKMCPRCKSRGWNTAPGPVKESISDEKRKTKH